MKHYLIPQGKKALFGEAGCQFSVLLETLYKLFGDTTEVCGEKIALECGGTTMVEFYRHGSAIYNREGEHVPTLWYHASSGTYRNHTSNDLCPEEIRQEIYGDNSFNYSVFSVPNPQSSMNEPVKLRVMWGHVVDSIGRETGWTVIPEKETFAHNGEVFEQRDAVFRMQHAGLTL